MPIVRIDNALVYFAHVPKCAGSAVEDYLRTRFGALAMLNRDHLDRPKIHRWSQTSPQHIDAASLDQLFPAEFFTARFAVVRHPVARMVSVFRYQRDVVGAISDDTSFEQWLDDLPKQRKKKPFQLDNHIRPMSDFVPGDARIFHLEKGLGPVINWLDILAGNKEGPRKTERVNTYAERLNFHKKRAGQDPLVTDSVRDKIHEHYAVDFERFDYDEEPAS